MTWTRLAVLVMTVGSASCTGVTSSHPVGEAAMQLQAQEWEGAWLDADGGVLLVNVMDGAAGELRVTWVEEQDAGHRLDESRVYARVSSKWVFGSIETERESASAPSEYLWGRMVMREDVLLVWRPAAEKFQQMVEAGVLPGEASVGNVRLGRLEREHMLLITSEEGGVLFDWDDPIVFRRLK